MRKPNNQKIKNAITLTGITVFCILLQIGAFSGRLFWDIEVRKNEEGYISLSEPEERGAYDWCTATDKHMYFSYSGQNGGVDVYDLDGNFLCWCYFDDIDKGAIHLRSEDNPAYVMLRNGEIYVFDGESFVTRYSDAEATTQGFDIDWFREEPQRLEVTNTYIYFLDSYGNRTGQIITPYNVHWGESASNMRQAHPVEIIATVLLFVFGFGMIAHSFLKDIRRK